MRINSNFPKLTTYLGISYQFHHPICPHHLIHYHQLYLKYQSSLRLKNLSKTLLKLSIFFLILSVSAILSDLFFLYVSSNSSSSFSFFPVGEYENLAWYCRWAWIPFVPLMNFIGFRKSLTAITVANSFTVKYTTSKKYAQSCDPRFLEYVNRQEIKEIQLFSKRVRVRIAAEVDIRSVFSQNHRRSRSVLSGLICGIALHLQTQCNSITELSIQLRHSTFRYLQARSICMFIQIAVDKQEWVGGRLNKKALLLCLRVYL